VDQGRVAGTLLALFLAKSSFADNRAVSLVGYSLGGVASFYCMRVLKQLNDFYNPRCGRIFNDVTLWAAAYIVDISKQYSEIREKSQNCTVCNGRLNNLYSPSDGALKHAMRQVYKGQWAVGLQPIFENIEEADLP